MAIGITSSLQNWAFQQHHVEQNMDDASFTAAHPDDTLVLAGPPRRDSATAANAISQSNSVLAIGMLQNVQFTSQKPTQPLMAIGSGRNFFVSGKSQTQWNIGRLFVNGRNLNRVLYHHAMAGGLDPTAFDDPAAFNQNDQYLINLDSELFYIPFGMGTLFKNKVHDKIGGFYAELCMVTTYAIGFSAGQNLILENVTGLTDRLLPWNATGAITYAQNRDTVDTIIGFTSSGQNNISDIKSRDGIAAGAAASDL